MAGQLTVDTILSSSSIPPIIKNNSGSEIGAFCRAWAYLVNGVIVKSVNISTVSKPSTGRYLFTFTNPMPDTNYGILALGNGTVSTGHTVPFIDSSVGSGGTYVHSTTQAQIAFWYPPNSANFADQAYLTVAFFG